ncbi:MAG TPA: site-2 protease family protein [Acidimicrobiales bacterium]
MSTTSTVDLSRPTPVEPPSNTAALFRLLAAILVIVALCAVLNSLPVLLVIAALVVMIMVHELGHFMAAKLSKMKVTEYFLGFGPRIWSIRRGETEYGVKAIPAGGYVRVVGMTTAEEIDPVDEPRSYREATFPRRFLVGVAGSAMHFVMALLLCYGLLAFTGVPTATSAIVGSLRNFANATAPAEASGMKAGDVLVSIDGKQYANGTDFVTAIQSHSDQRITVVVRRHGRLVTLRMTPLDGRKVKTAKNGAALDPAAGPAVGVIGIEVNYAVKNVRANPLVAVPRSAVLLGTMTKETVIGMGEVFSLHSLGNFAHQVVTATDKTSGSANTSASSTEFVSVVGAVQIGSQAVRHNIVDLLLILIGINLFVGMINLFPMLPLDGGHVVIAIYERIRSRRGHPYHADVTKLMPVAYVFLIVLLAIGLGALYLNILHPVRLPGS